jgi:hypothetical protein
MRHPITATLTALVIMGGLAVPVQGESITGSLSGDSILTATNTPGIYTQNFTGEGDDTTFGAFTSQSQSTIDFSKPPAITLSDGSLTETFSNGTLFGTSSGSGTANGMGTATVTIDFVITGGTGFFAGATGEVTITGTITTTGPTTESFSGSYVGTLSTVPEPNSLTLLALAMIPGAIVGGLQRRRGGREFLFPTVG